MLSEYVGKTRDDLNIDQLINEIKNNAISFSVISDLKHKQEISADDYCRIVFETSDYSGRWHDRGIIRDYADPINAVLNYRIKKHNNPIDAQNE